MITHPAQVLISALLGLLALAMLGIALYLLYRANKRHVVVVPVPDPADPARRDVLVARRRAPPAKKPMIAFAIALLGFVFAGKYLVALFYPKGEAAAQVAAAQTDRVRGASGADLSVTRFGPEQAPTLILTHGWGADSRALHYAAHELARQYRVILWDLPGLGASSPPANGDYSLQLLAADLNSVVESARGTPVVLVGHSIGGMLNIEYARRYSDKLGRDVRGIVQVNTTFTNPVETKKGAERSRKLQEPVFEPLLKLVTWTSPVVRALGWFSYQSGLAHLQLAKQSFAGAQTWAQLDHMARYAYQSSPAVVAHGVLAMLHWDGSDALRSINVPTLVISGDQDITTLPAASDRMAATIANAVRVSVDPAAHLGPIEQHGRYAQAISAFLRTSQAPAVALK